MANDRTTVMHRRHTIIARKSGNTWEGRAFRGKAPATEVHTAPTGDEVVTLVCADLDQSAAQERASRGADGYPTAKHVRAAYEQLKPADGQQAMLAAHLAAPDNILTATQLSKAAGKLGHEYANLQYGLLARALAEEMDYTPAERRADGSVIWTFALATGVDRSESDDPESYPEWRWQLRPEVVAALQA